MTGISFLVVLTFSHFSLPQREEENEREGRGERGGRERDGRLEKRRERRGEGKDAKWLKVMIENSNG